VISSIQPAVAVSAKRAPLQFGAKPQLVEDMAEVGPDPSSATTEEERSRVPIDVSTAQSSLLDLAASHLDSVLPKSAALRGPRRRQTLANLCEELESAAQRRPTTSPVIRAALQAVSLQFALSVTCDGSKRLGRLPCAS
jgi:hypothetical protein